MHVYCACARVFVRIKVSSFSKFQKLLSVDIEMTFRTVPLALPPSADPLKFSNFGRQVIGANPGDLSPSEFSEIQQLLSCVMGLKMVGSFKMQVITRLWAYKL